MLLALALAAPAGAQTTTLHIRTAPTDIGAQVDYAMDLGQMAVSSLAVAHEHGFPFVIIASGGAYSSKVPTSELIVAKNSPRRIRRRP